MGVSTPVQPDHTSQSGTVYKTSIDDGFNVAKRSGWAFAPHANSPADMKVAVETGHIPALGGLATEVAAQQTATFTAPTTNPRNDIVYVDAKTGTVGVAQGTEAASPSDPSIPAGTVAVARVRLTVGMTEITNADIDDLRGLGVLGLGTAAALNAGTAANELVQLDGAGKLPPVDGSQLTNLPSTGASETDMRLAFLLIAENAGDRVNMVGGIADPFADESDVDTAASTGQTYDSADDYYTNRGAEQAVSDSTGTTIGDMTGNGGLAAAFDGNNNQGFSACAAKTIDSTLKAVVGKDWGSGVTKRLTKAVIWDPNNEGFWSSGGTITIELLGGNTSDPNAATVLGSASAPYTTSGNQSVTVTATDITTGYRYHWVRLVVPTQSGTVYAAEVDFYEVGPTSDMTLISKAFTASAAPATGRIHIQIREIDTITINTDVIGEISRDGGTTWTSATLALQETLADGTKSYEDDNVDLSAQPSGTSMKWRVRTLNSKEIEVHGVVLQWA